LTLARLARAAATTVLAGALAACTLAPTAAPWVPAAPPPPPPRSAPGGLPDLQALVQHSAPAVVGIADDRPQVQAGNPGVLGSGFRIAGTPLVATAAHVVAALVGPPVVVWQGQRWPARLLRLDETTDLALLAVGDTAPMPGLVLAAADAVAPGQWVLVLGCPFGTQPTATVGIVSALPGAVLQPAALRQRLQLNAAVNPGNSGGPVLGLDGRVIAVANATVSGGYGLGFAVPVAALQALLDRVAAPGTPQR